MHSRTRSSRNISKPNAASTQRKDARSSGMAIPHPAKPDASTPEVDAAGTQKKDSSRMRPLPGKPNKETEGVKNTRDKGTKRSRGQKT